MLRLIIVDDERVIRETISKLIDWKSMGINVVGVCKDGIEAYDAIVDEYPDIVLTDIKMPGLSGLELIQRIMQTYDKIEFVILSGYGEFNFAAEAMKYGVKHYLLKPCNEVQIIEVMEEIKKECYYNRAMQTFQEEQKLISTNLHESIIRNIIMEEISSLASLSTLAKSYARFLDFTNTDYELCYFYFLEESSLEDVLRQIHTFHAEHSPSITFYEFYVKNTLLIFFEGYQTTYEELDAFACSVCSSTQSALIEYKRIPCENLYLILDLILKKLKRYSMIYSINGLRKTPICNYDTLFQKVEQIFQRLENIDLDTRKASLNEIKEILSYVSNADFLKSLITNILLKKSGQANFGSVTDIAELLLSLNSLQDVSQICELFYSKLGGFLQLKLSDQPVYKSFIEKTLRYIDEHLADPNLSLKWIADNYLFMNVDYVSKQFIKQTGFKFSNYLNKMRIKKAKELLLECDTEKIYTIAEQIGCGDHPQYFSQLFKKHTGMTPTAYVKQMK